MVGTHVDDIKATGEPQQVKMLKDILEKNFGKLKIHDEKFTNVGIRHELPRGSSISMMLTRTS